MDEKEFIISSEQRPFIDEKNNLADNYEKLHKVLDYYKKTYDSAKRDMENFKGDYDTVLSFLEARNDADKYSRRIFTYKSILDSPYNMHLLLKSQDGEEDLFLGTVEDIVDENNDHIIYSVWSPIASQFYRRNNTSCHINGYTYKLLLKRSINIENRQLLDVVEEYNVNKGFDEEVTDVFLRKILKSKKNEQGFTDIIKSIQANQNDIIRSDINDNIICQGVAGSGKTAIIVHRLSYLFYNYREISADKYLFIAPNDNFKKELGDLNKKLRIDEILINTLYDYYKEKINNYLEDAFGIKPKYEITNIIDDKNPNIGEIYSNDYLNNKYFLILDNISSKLQPIFIKYDLEYDFNKSYIYNKNAIITVVNKSRDKFIKDRTAIVNEFKRIEQTCKEIGQDAYSVVSIDDYNSFLLNYEDNINKEIDKYKLLIPKLNDEIEKQKILIDYDFYRRYDFNSENLIDQINEFNEDLNDLVEDRDSFIAQKEELNKSKINVINIIKVNNLVKGINSCNSKIEELYSKIDECNKRLKRFISPEYTDMYNHYVELNDRLNSSLIAIENLKYATKLGSLAINSIEAYSKLKKINFIDNTNCIHYQRILINSLNNVYQLPTTRDKSVDIQDLEYYLENSISIDSNLDYDRFIEDNDNFNAIKSVIDTKNIVSKCFEIVLNNKYRLTPETLKTQKFERNDIFLLLYIFNQLDIGKHHKYDYIFIDEAQDYNDEEIKLIYDIEEHPILNIFGDYKQNISKNSYLRSNWKDLIKTLDNSSKYYELNENYRNTTNVVDYCNNKIKSNMTSVGVEGNNVTEIDKMLLSKLINLYYQGDNHIITNNSELIEKLRSLNANIKCNSVLDVKGLEFENVIVVNDPLLDENNCYVAYTRTKNDLIIVNEIIFDDVTTLEPIVETYNNKEIKLESKIDDTITKDTDEKSVKTFIEEPKNNLKDKLANNDFIKNLINGYLKDAESLQISIEEFCEWYKVNEISKKAIVEKYNHIMIAKGELKPSSAIRDTYSLDEKYKCIMNIINDVEHIHDYEVRNILAYYSKDGVEKNALYNKIINNGITILEDD